MDKQSLKHVLYGGIEELMSDRSYYRKSSIDPRYSEWHEEGKVAVMAFLDFISREIQVAEEAELKKKAKELTIDALKGKEI